MAANTTPDEYFSLHDLWMLNKGKFLGFSELTAMLKLDNEYDGELETYWDELMKERNELEEKIAKEQADEKG